MVIYEQFLCIKQNSDSINMYLWMHSMRSQDVIDSFKYWIAVIHKSYIVLWKLNIVIVISINMESLKKVLFGFY